MPKSIENLSLHALSLKHQGPRRDSRNRLELEIWCLVFLWSLGFGIWCFLRLIPQTPALADGRLAPARRPVPENGESIPDRARRNRASNDSRTSTNLSARSRPM